MTRSDDERIADVIDACRELMALVQRGREAFDQDRAIQLAIERLLEIIGEAANAIDGTTRSRYQGVDWTGITRLRIVLAHHYHRIDPELVWAMAADEIPRLLEHLDPGGS